MLSKDGQHDGGYIFWLVAVVGAARPAARTCLSLSSFLVLFSSIFSPCSVVRWLFEAGVAINVKGDRGAAQ